MINFLNNNKLKPFKLKNLILLITVFAVVGCGNENDTNTITTEQGDNVSFQIPDSLLGNKVDRNNLSATITVNGGPPQTMSIDDLNDSANVSLSSIPTGSNTFVIQFTYDFNGTILTLAEASKTFTVTTGSNNLTFLATDYNTAFDNDNDGITNIAEVDETSTTSPTVALCQLGTAELGNCELGS